MKFGDKYEVLEMVTSGRVSTLLGRERTTQEAVVVYTFEYVAAGELSTAAIITRFCELAPNPPGMIVKAGYDAPTSTAFITTKMPDPVALQAWVKAYHSFVPKVAAPAAAPPPPQVASASPNDATVEWNASEVKSVLAQSGAGQRRPAEPGASTDVFGLALSSPPPQQQSAGEFTQLFRDLSALEPGKSESPAAAKPGNATGALFGEKPSAPSTPPPGKSTPGSFTQEFLGLSAPPPDPAPKPSGPPVPAKEEPVFSLGGPEASGPSANEFTRLFQEVNAFQPVKKSEASAASRPGEATGAVFGESLGSRPLGGSSKSAVPPSPPQASPGSFTQEFLGLSSPSVEPATNAAPVPPPQKEPGAFTREFMAISQDAFRKSEPASSPSFALPKQNPPAPAPSFDNIFGEPTPQNSAPTAGGGAKDSTGEFTNYFRGPFENPSASQKPLSMPDIASTPAPQNQAGEFTKMFGPGDLRPAEPSDSPFMKEQPKPAEGSFTQIFGPGTPGSGQGSQRGMSTPGTNPNARPSFLDTPPATPPSAAPDPFRPMIPPVQPAPPPAPPRVDPFFSGTPTPNPASPFGNRAASTEATNIFRTPGAAAPPVQAPSGPSEFTMFLSRSDLPPEAQAQLGGPAAPPPPAPSPFQFAPPPPPPVPKIPAAPAPPAMPRPPAIPGVAPKASSIWPLITGLTILFAIAAILIVYFLLKH